jgi:MFS family permease
MMVAVSAFGPAALMVAVAPLELAVPAAGAMVLVDSFGIGLHGVNQVSLRQAVTPEWLRGRMIATLRFLNFGAIPLGTMLGGALGTLVGLRPAIWVGTAGLFLAALPYALSSTHRVIELPRPPGRAPCRPPARWDHLALSCANGLGPPVAPVERDLMGGWDRLQIAGIDLRRVPTRPPSGRSHAPPSSRRTGARPAPAAPGSPPERRCSPRRGRRRAAARPARRDRDSGGPGR